MRLFDALSWQMNTLATSVGEGRTESPPHPLGETCDIIGTVESARSSVSGPS